jgi:hypothetical protein
VHSATPARPARSASPSLDPEHAGPAGARRAADDAFGHELSLPFAGREADLLTRTPVLELVGRMDNATVGAIDAYGLAVRGDTVFVGQSSLAGSWLTVVDVSDPTAPRRLGRTEPLPCDCPPVRVAAAGDLVFASSWSAGLLVFDVSDPTAPRLTGSVATTGGAMDVADDESHVYLTPLDGAGLVVIDVTDPTAPREVGRADAPGLGWAVTAVGGHASVADQEHGLRVFDVSDPAAPRAVALLETRHAADVVVADGYAYLASRSNFNETPGGLRVIDVGDPTRPREVAALVGFDPGSGAAAEYVAVADDRVFLVAGNMVHVFDVREPAAPRHLAKRDVPRGQDNLFDVAAEGRHAYAVEPGVGLFVLRYDVR